MLIELVFLPKKVSRNKGHEDWISESIMFTEDTK